VLRWADARASTTDWASVDGLVAAWSTATRQTAAVIFGGLPAGIRGDLLAYGVPDRATVDFGAPDPADRVKRRPPEADHEVDLFTGPVLQAALADSLAQGPCDLLIDLAAMTFCDVRGLAMLVQAGATAAECGIGYAVAAAPRQLRRVWPMLWPAAELPVQYPSTAAGVLAALTRRHDDDLARWAPKRGPGWSRHWPTPRLQVVPGHGPVMAERLVAPLG
jgi:STAS domain